MLHLHFSSSIHEFFFQHKVPGYLLHFPTFLLHNVMKLWNMHKHFLAGEKLWSQQQQQRPPYQYHRQLYSLQINESSESLKRSSCIQPIFAIQNANKAGNLLSIDFTKWSLCELFCSILMLAGIREFSIQWAHWIFIRNANLGNSAFNSFIYFIGTISPIVEIQGGKNVMSKMFKKFN